MIRGASAGIGRETALEFARRNCRLVLASSQEDLLRAVATEVQRYSIQTLAVTDVANAIVECARCPRAEVYSYPPARILPLASLLFPKLVDRYMASLVKKAQQ